MLFIQFKILRNCKYNISVFLVCDLNLHLGKSWLKKSKLRVGLSILAKFVALK